MRITRRGNVVAEVVSKKVKCITINAEQMADAEYRIFFIMKT